MDKQTKSRTIPIFGTLAGLSLIGFMTAIWPGFGNRPGEMDRKRFKASQNYNGEKNVFENRVPDLMSEMYRRIYRVDTIKEWMNSSAERVPKARLPELKPDVAKFIEPSNDIKVIWFGHSSFVLNIDGVIVLVDPVFSGSASPFGALVRRFQPPVLGLDELPEVDYVVISHDHYDHLDMASIRYFANKKARFVTPLGIGSHLESWGIGRNRITERDWWQEVSFDGITFTATPAQHFSGRTGIYPNQTLWASWVMQTARHTVFYSGDSGYDIHFRQIGEAYGPFDVAFIESGQYNEKWKEVHMLPHEAAQAYFDLKAKKYFPVHWGMFELAFHAWYDPVDRLFTMSKKREIDLITAKIGEIVSVNEMRKADDWWRHERQASAALVNPRNGESIPPIMSILE